MLTSTGRALERVLLFGLEGCGKSDAILDVATRVGVTVWVIDNDNAWDRMLEGTSVTGEQGQLRVEYRWDAEAGDWIEDSSWAVEGGNIVLFHAEGWESHLSALDEVRGAAAREDWLCVDSASTIWAEVQDHFGEDVFGESLADLLLAARKEQVETQRKAKPGTKEAEGAKNLRAYDGWTDWQVINAQYRQKIMRVLVNPPCNLLVTAEEAQVSGEEGKDVAQLYNRYGVKAGGQKKLGHNVQTVLWLMKERNGGYKARTIKDRGGREYLVGEDVTDRGFGEWYLEGVGGWVEGEPAVAPVESPPAVKRSKAPAADAGRPAATKRTKGA